MKRVLPIISIIMLGMLCNIYAKDTSETAKDGIDIPCLMSAFDNEKEVAAWGVGRSTDNSQAYLAANQDAIASLANRFHLEKTEIGKYASMNCRQITRNKSGEYIIYVSVTIRKSDLFELLKNKQ